MPLNDTDMNINRCQMESLKRFWCLLNGWHWPKELGPRPAKLGSIDPDYKRAWERVNARIVWLTVRDYWANEYRQPRERKRK